VNSPVLTPATPSAASPHGKKLWLTLFAAFLGWMFDGMEMGIFPLVASPALKAMQLAQGIEGDWFVKLWMGRITALFLLGAAAGGLVFGWLGDRIGRVKAMTYSILTYSLFAGLAYFAQQPWQLGALRALGALGMGGEWSLGVALVMESWPADKRPWMAASIGAAANLGYCLIAGIGILFPITQDSWRWVMLVGATPAILTFLIRLFVPESELWKEAQSKPATNPVREIFAPALLRNTTLAIVFASVALIVTWGIVQWIPLWADEMAKKANHPLKDTAKAYAQLFQSMGAVIGSLSAPLLGIYFGRRPIYFVLCFSSLLACTLLFQTFSAVSPGFFAVVLLVGACTSSFYGWLPQYLPELFPTRVRATGQGLAFNFGRVFAATGAWQMGALLSLFGGSYPKAGMTVCTVYLVGMACVWLAPETRGKPLPE